MHHISDRVVEDVKQFCLKHDLLHNHERILLAVSGGPDSSALLHIFHMLQRDLDLGLAVIHVNHGLRGSDSDNDQKFVEKRAEELGFACFCSKIPVKSLRKKGESPEEAARRLRYRFMIDTMKERGFDVIATGHSLEDNVETILYRLASGTGPGGVAGIQPRSRRVIHPLITLSRDRILEYLKKYDTSYCVDKTNLDRSIPRNRIRHEILPLLSTINPRFREHFCNFAGVQRQENALIERLLEERLEKVVIEHDEYSYVLDYHQLMQVDEALRRRMLIRIYTLIDKEGEEYVRRYLPFKVLDNIASSEMQGNKTIYKNSAVLVQKEYDNLVFKKRVVDTRARGYLYSVHDIRQPQRIPEINKVLIFSLVHNDRFFENGKFQKNRIYIDYGEVSLPLIVRSRKDGDRIELKNVGHKKLKDLFIDHKTKSSIRNYVPVLENQGEVIGVLSSLYGMDNRVSAKYSVKEDTANVLVGELKDWKS
jgi:tRNA(Ile)-lysidine synthase